MKLIYVYENADENTDFFLAAIKPYISEIIMVNLQKSRCHNVIEAYIQTIMQMNQSCHDMDTQEDVILANDRFFGPFIEIKDLINGISDKEDVIGLYYQEAYLYTYQADQPHIIQPCYSSMDFCFMSKKVYQNTKFFELLQDAGKISEELYQAKCYQWFIENGYVVNNFYDFGKYFSEQPISNFDVGKFLPYELITEYNFPFLMKKSIIYDRNKYMDFTDYMSFSKSIQYIREYTLYDENIIMKYLIEHYNVADIVDMLNLQYVLSNEELTTIPRNTNNSAVFMHLYYEDVLDVYLTYIKNIPLEMDVYITTETEQNKKKIISYMKKINRKNYKVIEKKNKGRDLSSLLVTFYPYYDKYKYICFIHDKKTIGGKGASILGKQFSQLMWDNLLYGKNYMYRIIDLFEQNKLLGFLAPPKASNKMYYEYYYETWSKNYENTKDLLERMNIDTAYIKKEKQPFALSTSFWCRSEILKPLMQLEWKYEDFPEEPLPTDGTISHALERVFPYVAQSCGYYSGIVMNNLYSSGIMLNSEKRLSTVSKCIADNMPYQFLNGYDKLVAFLKLVQWNVKEQRKKYYIYGCGQGGEHVYHVLKQQGIEVEGFITSDGYEKSGNILLEKPVYYLSEIEDKEIFVFIGVCWEYYDEVVMNLENAGIFDYY